MDNNVQGELVFSVMAAGLKKGDGGMSSAEDGDGEGVDLCVIMQ
jgi:hypothetical protein